MPRRCLSCGDGINAMGYCVRCGTEASTSDVHGTELSPSCPRCGVALAPIAFGAGAVLRCPGCAGALVTPADWGELLGDHDAERQVVAQMVPPLPGKALPDSALAALVRCPVCRREMDRFRFAALTDVSVDTCADHGLWFDAKELVAVLRRVRAREEAALSGQRAPEDEAAEREWAAHLQSLQRITFDHAMEMGANRSSGDDIDLVLPGLSVLFRRR